MRERERERVCVCVDVCVFCLLCFSVVWLVYMMTCIIILIVQCLMWIFPVTGKDPRTIQRAKRTSHQNQNAVKRSYTELHYIPHSLHKPGSTHQSVTLTTAQHSMLSNTYHRQIKSYKTTVQLMINPHATEVVHLKRVRTIIEKRELRRQWRRKDMEEHGLKFN